MDDNDDKDADRHSQFKMIRRRRRREDGHVTTYPLSKIGWGFVNDFALSN